MPTTSLSNDDWNGLGCWMGKRELEMNTDENTDFSYSLKKLLRCAFNIIVNSLE